MAEKPPGFAENVLNEPQNKEKILPESEKKRIFDIVFSRKFVNRGKSVEYFSSDPTFQRKRVVLENGSKISPVEGKPYQVEVVRDTVPNNPKKGELIVKIIESIKLKERKNRDVIEKIILKQVAGDPDVAPKAVDPETGKLLILRLIDDKLLKPGYSYSVYIDQDNIDSSTDRYLVRIIPNTEEPIIEGQKIERKKDEIAPKDREAQFHRASRLRDSVHFRIMMQIVRRDPQVYEELLQVLKRWDDFKENLAEQGEHHRDFAALFSAIHLNKRAAMLLDQAIDRTTEAESEWIKEKIRNGENYVHELVIGSGVHSGVYRQERLMYIPDDPGLAIDRSHKLGGQFAQSGGDVHGLNSRNRPENKELPHLPGTEGSLNTQGTKAVVQPSDASGKVYISNWDIAQSVRANQFLIGRNAIDLELRNVEKIPDGQEGQGLLKVFVVDMKTGEEFIVRTDRLILTTGLDKENYGLDQLQGSTKKLLEASQAAIKAGERAKIYRSNELLGSQADQTNPFPQQGIKEVVSWGRGDSWKVAIGSLLGHEGQVGKTVTQLDRVQKVIAIGQEFLTKEKFLECERARYATLGLEFPREKVESYYYRIEPYKGRALYLEEDDQGNPILVAEIEDNNGRKEIKRFTIGKNAIGMSAAGFTDKTDEVLQEIGKREIIEQAEIERNQNEILSGVGNVIEYASTNSQNQPNLAIPKLAIVERYDKTSNRASIRVVYTKGEDGVFDINIIDETVFKKFLLISPPPVRVILKKPILPNLKEVRILGFEDPVATQYEGLPIQRIGPAAQLKLTEKEKKRSPVLEQIPENTASIFRYTDYVAAVARMNAERDIENGFDAPRGLSLLEPEKKRVNLPSLSTKRGRGGFASSSFELSAEKGIAEKYLPMGANVKDLLNFVIGEKSAAYVFPEDLKNIMFHVARAENSTGTLGFKINSTPKLPMDYNTFFAAIFEDQLMQRMVRQFTERGVSTNSEREVDIIIPFMQTPGGENVPYVGRIDYSIPIKVRPKN